MEKEKTNSERIKRIFKIVEEHFGKETVRFVGLKFEPKYGFIAKVKFNDNENHLNIFEYSDDATEALRKLKKRIKKIIKRYNYI